MTDTTAAGMTLGDLAAFMGTTPSAAAEALGLKESSARVQPRAEEIRRYLAGRGIEGSFRVVAHVNMRGGIGKTTAATALAERASQLGFRVCLLDLDSQASASLAFGVTLEEDEPVFYDVWQNPAEEVGGALRELSPLLSLLPSSLQNGLLDSALASPVAQKNAVRNVCSVLRDLGFDLVVVDCPPSLGAAVISTVCAADEVVIPAGADAFSFKGIAMTLGEISSICDTFHLEQPRARILYSRYDRRERASIEALERLRREYPDLLMPAAIRTSAEYVRTLGRGRTLFSTPGRNRAKDDYDGYVRELLGIPSARPAAEDLVREVPSRGEAVPSRKEEIWPDLATVVARSKEESAEEAQS